MLHQYNGSASLLESIEVVTSGEEPCSLCLSIAKARSTETEHPIPAFPIEKLSNFFMPLEQDILLFAPPIIAAGEYGCSDRLRWAMHSIEPPTPPPR